MLFPAPMPKSNWCAIHTGGPHYLDHLGVLSILLNLQLLVTEEETFQAARQYYPALSVELIPLKDLTLHYMAYHFDVIFESGHYWAAELLPLFDLLFHKKMRIVYCPHGNSDKRSLHRMVKDISLVYGNHMVDHLRQTGESLNEYIFTGNYRFFYYLKNKNFYDFLLMQQVGRKVDQDKKAIFYAPSWSDQESSLSFLTKSERIIEEVGTFYNIIIRFHPFFNEIYPGCIEQLLDKYEDTKGVIFLNEFPCIYPILNYVDGYLGDFSSIGYDFLSFDKPLYFINRYKGALYKVGTVLSWDHHLGKSIYSHKETPFLKRSKKILYENVFGEEKKEEEIVKKIESALSKERAFF